MRLLYSCIYYAICHAHIILGAFRKLRKVTTSYVRSVGPSDRMEQLGSHWTDFHEIRCFSIFRKSLEKIQVSLQSDKNKYYFTWRQIYIFLIVSRSFLLRMRNVSDKSYRDNQNTRFVFSNLFFLKIDPFMRKCGKIFQSGTGRRWQYCACWIPKAINTNTQVV